MKPATINKAWLFRNCWFAYFALLLCWGLADYADIIKQFQLGQLLLRRHETGSLIIADFVLWYGAALLAKRTDLGPVNVYDLDLQFRNLQEIIRPFTTDQGQPVQYPPHFFAMIKPMVNLSMGSAYITWCLLALPLIVTALFYLSKLIKDARFSRAFFILAGLASYPTCYAFSNGQTTLYQFPALAAFWLLVRSERFFAAGIFASLLTVKLQYAPFVILAGLILGRVRLLLGLLTGGAILAAFTIASIGIQNIIVYPQALMKAETTSWVGAQVMQNFRGELIIFNGDNHFVHQLSTGLFLTSIVATGLLWSMVYPKLAKSGRPMAFGLCLLLTTCTMLICSPHTHFQDYMTLSIPVAFLYSWLKNVNSKEYKERTLKFLLWSFPLFSWLAIYFYPLLVLAKIQPYFVWTFLVVAISINLCFDITRVQSKI
jgi:Glycosyltransferase family 87